MPFTITKEFKFEAAHVLVGHDGPCARLHGHSWKGRVVVRGSELHRDGPKAGMLVDYGDLKAVLEPLVDGYLDHRFLNETLATDRPTSEAVATWLYGRLVGQFGPSGKLGPHALLAAVEIDETCTSCARYGEP
jgi:6-pyruvoyltetrahydropterin/6-carboxytetrahydropterin synthase